MEERVEKLAADVKDLQRQMDENTEITKQVRDILASFRVAAAVAKWIAAVAAGVTALYHGWTSIRHP